MRPPLVSVIIPFYNSECHLADTIQSVIDQTWPHIEIILVDDGSSDGSSTVAKKYESLSIKVFRQDNKGASSARNFGLSQARGKYIQFLDADDLLSADKITEQVKLLESHPEKIAVCSTVHFRNGMNPFSNSPSAYEESFLMDTDPVTFLINLWGGYSANGSMVTIHAWLTPKHLIDKAGAWNEELSIDDDGEYFCRVLLQSAGLVKSNGYSYYRKYVSSSNLSAGKSSSNLRSQLTAMMLKYRHLSVHTDSPDLKKAYLKNLCQFKFNLYPLQQQLYALAEHEIKITDPDFTYDYRFPSKTGEWLNKIFGWKITKFFQLFKLKLTGKE